MLRCQALGWVALEALVDQSRQDLVIVFERVRLVNLERMYIGFGFVDRSALEGVLLRYQVVEATAERPRIRIGLELLRL